MGEGENVPNRDRLLASEGIGSPVVSIEKRLDSLAANWGREAERATEEKPAADILFDRLLHIYSEDTPHWDKLSKEHFRQVFWAYQYLAYPHFSKGQQLEVAHEAFYHQKHIPDIPINPIVLMFLITEK